MLFILVQIQAGPPAIAAPQLRLGKPYRSEGCRGVAEGQSRASTKGFDFPEFPR
jgi:hypothetical protein